MRYFPQVCFGDLTESRGEDVHAELSAKHGENNVLYRQCDISKDDDVKGLLVAIFQIENCIVPPSNRL